MQDFFYSCVFIISLLLLIIVCQDALSGLFEILLLKDCENIYIFKQSYRKRPFLKRFLMLPVFDAVLVNDCKRKNMLQKLFVIGVSHLSLGCVAIVLKSCLTALQNYDFEIAFLVYFVLLLLFYCWYIFYSIRWNRVQNRNRRNGQRELDNQLSDDTGNKKEE